MASIYIIGLLTLFFTTTSATSYAISENYDSTNFFTNFDFFTANDPTNGWVTYQTQAAAESLGLTKIVNGNQVYIGVYNSTTQGQNSTGIPSVRLQSKSTYTKMLLVADVVHMPFACGAWPAFWTYADPWPQNGEIDSESLFFHPSFLCYVFLSSNDMNCNPSPCNVKIDHPNPIVIEGVNSQTTNAMTLHTSATCQVTNGTQSPASTFVEGTNCNAPGTGHTGCQQRNTATDTTANYGAGFNEAGGGVYVMEWTSSAISVWFFPRNSIPGSLGGDAVDVSALGTPLVQFVSDAGAGGCDFDQHFLDQKITIDTTL